MSWSRHLAKGLRLLGERRYTAARRWISAGEGALDKAVRMVMVGVAGWVLWQVASASWKTLAVAVLLVILMALRAATKAAKAPPKRAPEEAPGPRRELFGGEFQDAVRDALGGSPAVHLTTLADHLTALTGDTWTGQHVRAACATHGIPVRPKVRDLGGDRVSSGVHRDDLHPLPQPLPEGAQKGPVDAYAAGQSGNATPLPGPHATTPTPTVRRVGDLRITSVDDPHNPARTHVTITDPTRKKAPK